MDLHAKMLYRAFTLRFNGRTNVLIGTVRISLPYSPNKDIGKTPPILTECRAIWDTGATNSVITKKLASEIGLVPTGKEKVTNTTVVELRNSFLVNIYLPNKVAIPYLKVTECEDVLGNGNADMLIGMDVIARGDFTITYENGKTVMSLIMPPIGTIDFVPVSEQENKRLEKFQNIQAQEQVRKVHLLSKKSLKAKRKKERQNRRKNRRKH